MSATQGNFTFLGQHDPVLLRLATTAEQVFASDPNTTLIKLRQLGEALAQALASQAGIKFDVQTTQLELIQLLNRHLDLDPGIRNLFQTLRIEGNRATHGFSTQHREAMDGLRVARELCIWYHRTSGKAGSSFRPGPFTAPTDPSAALRALHGQIETLEQELRQRDEALEGSRKLAELRIEESAQSMALAEAMDEEARALKVQLDERAAQFEQERIQFHAQLQTLQQANNAEQPQTTALVKRSRQAAAAFDPDEELTRILIDQQLRDAGWEADSLQLTWSKGVRPEKGRCMAIAEWPTRSAKACADYVLFDGLMPVAIVEAKRRRVNIAERIDQAERYSRDLPLTAPLQLASIGPAGGPWADGQGAQFQVPFAYACNGRPWIKQLAEQSGIWFRDLRSPANLKRPLQQFHTPQGLAELMLRDRELAEQRLSTEPYGYLKLRPYQQDAIAAVEKALASGQRHCLLAMATGTGKTRTTIGLIYRLLKAERFTRILFLVDRTSLGTQAREAFDDMSLEQGQSLSQIYNVNDLGDMAAEAETRVQVATVQAMVRRLFQSDAPPPIDQFDCIIVDEAHRGYTLDQEMTEGELSLRDHAQYLSQYRRVLEYFDACRIGLTATPARQTTEIFGRPVYTYSYREAVADDWLIDHEPPIRFETQLSRNGIHFDKGERVEVVNALTGEVDSAELDDELSFDIESFNRSVITADFDRVICQALADELDPLGEEKTLVFCVNQVHAVRVCNLLNAAFHKVYGDEWNQAAVQVITGRTDEVAKVIRRYKTERLPSVAITVDLLTTGIDVPAITNLVFMRRVRSRILYEQMKGRATRRCDDIGKTVFRIYDPVRLYEALEAVDTMRPLVKDPNISVGQLLHELQDPRSHQPGSSPEAGSHAQDVLDQLSQKLMRVLRRASHKAQNREPLRKQLEQLETAWGVEPAKLHQHLHGLGPEQAASFIATRLPALEAQIDELRALLASEQYPIISHHTDTLLLREVSYGGNNQKPADYLESFTDFIRSQLNQSAALAAVVNRPRDLTREQLREVRLLLDGKGYNEAHLHSAERQQSNRDIAAGIIGYIRRAAIGEALLPYEQRVHRALDRILASRSWTPVQQRWLKRLANQLVTEVVIDRDSIQHACAPDGGVKLLDTVFAGQLDQLIEQFKEAVWEEVA